MSIAPITQSGTQSGAATGQVSTPAIGQTALTSLSSNFSNFLRMLMTQLQNQDPTSPMDANEFTRELVQFSSVEQQIATNTSMTITQNATAPASMLRLPYEFSRTTPSIRLATSSHLSVIVSSSS